jgi:hypothetical protein
MVDNRMAGHGQDRIIIPNGANDAIRRDGRPPTAAAAAFAPARSIEIHNHGTGRTAEQPTAGPRPDSDSDSSDARGHSARQRAHEPRRCGARPRRPRGRVLRARGRRRGGGYDALVQDDFVQVPREHRWAREGVGYEALCAWWGTVSASHCFVHLLLFGCGNEECRVLGCPGSLFYNRTINNQQSLKTKAGKNNRTLILFILCTNSPPILAPLFDLLPTAADIDVVDQMARAVCGGGKVVGAPPDVVDDKLEVIRRRWDVDHCLEAFRAGSVKREE